MAKVDRLIGILTILLQQRRVTAPYLADRFEVSRRTIHRDIEGICQAGIPVVTAQGAGGGIEIMDGYSIDKSVFTIDEIETLVDALHGMDTVFDNSYADRFLEKLSGEYSAKTSSHTMQIDLSSHHRATLTDKIKRFRRAISENRLVRFTYYSGRGDTERTVEPYLLLYHWSDWYLYAYCTLRSDYRLFKLARLWNAQDTDQKFTPRTDCDMKRDWDQCFSSDIELRAIFDDSVKYRLIEDYGIDSLVLREDGRYDFCFPFTFEDNLIQWLLGFGPHVEVISPPEIRKRLSEDAQKIFSLYTEPDT
jgi:predicted DNA-binding transcriptional regulator YafY